MNNDTYQSWALTIENQNFEAIKARMTDENIRLMHAALGIGGEAGELVDLIKKTILYGKVLDKDKAVKEAGDILWYMAVLLDTIGSSFDEVMQANHDKLSVRYSGGYSDKAAIERKDVKSS